MKPLRNPGLRAARSYIPNLIITRQTIVQTFSAVAGPYGEFTYTNKNQCDATTPTAVSPHAQRRNPAPTPSANAPNAATKNSG